MYMYMYIYIYNSQLLRWVYPSCYHVSLFPPIPSKWLEVLHQRLRLFRLAALHLGRAVAELLLQGALPGGAERWVRGRWVSGGISI